MGCDLQLVQNITCGEDDILGNELMIHNGELRKLDLVHPGDSVVSASPVELDVIRGVAIWDGV